MTDAPERIWVQLDDIKGYENPVELTDPASWAFRPYQPYVRADLYDALQAENERLRGAIPEAYRRGFNASAEGWNGEHPCGHETDGDWLYRRKVDIADLLTATDAAREDK